MRSRSNQSQIVVSSMTGNVMRRALAKRGNFSTTLSIPCSKLERNVDGFDINEIPLLRVSNESRVQYRTRCSLRKIL